MDRLRRLDIGGVIIGLLIIGIGGYYLLVNTFGFTLPELDWDKVWPIAVIALGAGIAWGAWARQGSGHEMPGSK